MERSCLDNNGGVLSVGSGEEIPLAVGLLCTHKDDVWDEIAQQASVQLDVSMDRANFKDPVLEYLCNTKALGSCKREDHLLCNSEFEQREVLGAANAGDD